MSLKLINKNYNFSAQFNQLNEFSGSISNRFGAFDSREVSLRENVYDFSIDCNAIDKSDILNIHKYLMSKNNIK